MNASSVTRDSSGATYVPDINRCWTSTRNPRSLSKDDDTNVEIERALLAREQVSRLWMATGALDPEVRAAAFSTGAVLGETMAPWADAEIPIDGTAVALRRLGDDRYWLAQASHGRLLVAIGSRGWPVESSTEAAM